MLAIHCQRANLTDVLNNLDCDDGRAEISPDADETLTDGIDQDCDGYDACYLDSDNDGYGSETIVLVAAPIETGCVLADGYDDDNSDCDDAYPTEYPGQDWYSDADGDTYGDTTALANVCEKINPNDVLNNRDCDNISPLINPAASETLCDGTGIYQPQPVDDGTSTALHSSF